MGRPANGRSVSRTDPSGCNKTDPARSYSLTSSVLVRSDGGAVMPSALRVPVCRVVAGGRGNVRRPLTLEHAIDVAAASWTNPVERNVFARVRGPLEFVAKRIYR